MVATCEEQKHITRQERIRLSIAKRESLIRKKQSGVEAETRDSVLIAFTFYVVAIAAKFSLVNEKGTFSEKALAQLKDEIETFKEVFSLPSSVVPHIEKYYVEALHDNLDVLHCTKQIMTLFPDNKVLIEQLAQNLFIFIDASGGFSPARTIHLKRMVLSLGFNENYFRRLLRARIIPQDESPFQVLGVAEDVSYVELKKAHRMAVKEWHPDRFSAISDTPVELLEAATDRFNRISQAFQAIKLKRGFSLS